MPNNLVPCTRKGRGFWKVVNKRPLCTSTKNIICNPFCYSKDLYTSERSHVIVADFHRIPPDSIIISNLLETKLILSIALKYSSATVLVQNIPKV